MAGNPLENARGKGFWNGGEAGHGNNRESSGRQSGYPGRRGPKTSGVKTDIEFPSPDDDVPAELPD
jgi:hypothetical protein